MRARRSSSSLSSGVPASPGPPPSPGSMLGTLGTSGTAPSISTIKYPSENRCLQCFHGCAALLRKCAIRLVRRFKLPLLLLVLCGLVMLVFHLLSDRVHYQNLEHFSYPLDVDLLDVIEREVSNRALPPDVWPVNVIPQNVLIGSSGSCGGAEVLVLVKSVHEARANRMAIRQTWGRSDCLPPLKLRVVFLLGTHPRSADEEDHLRAEQALHKDILQFDFTDSYQHNTYKVFAGLKFAVDQCISAQTIILMDDDYILNPWRLAAYLRHVAPALQPRLVAGWVYYGATPRRHWSDKWRVSFSEYPYSEYPAYPTGGTVIYSRDIARNLSIAAKYVRYLAFDDVYLGILLHKMHLLPVHSRLMWWQEPPVQPERLSRYISSHGFREPDELRRAWRHSGLSLRCVGTNMNGQGHAPPLPAARDPQLMRHLQQAHLAKSIRKPNISAKKRVKMKKKV